MPNTYKLPNLQYEYWELWPHITEEQLRIHHDKHHQAYVNNANQLTTKLEASRAKASRTKSKNIKGKSSKKIQKSEEIDIKAITRSLTFNVGGHKLHSLFWNNLQPTSQEVEVPAKLEKIIKQNFVSFDQLQQEFSQAANSVEGSGWAALVYDKQTGELLISQIEKHNLNLFPNHDILLVIDVWEHAYYLDYKNDRARFVQGFWEIVNWHEVEKRLKEAEK